MAVFTIASADDTGFEDGTGTVDLTDSSIEFFNDDEWVAFRFTNVTVPQGAVITEAYITIACPNGTFDEIAATLYCEDSDNSGALAATSNNISNRTLTTAGTSWIDSNLQAPGNFASPSLVSAVQEVVDRAGWASGNAMTVIFDAETNIDLRITLGTTGTLTINTDAEEPVTHNIVVSDFLGGETNRTRQLTWTREVAENAGFADNVNIGVLRRISVADNLGGSTAFMTDTFAEPDTVETATQQDYAGFSDNVLIDVNYREIFVVDYLGAMNVHGPPQITGPTPIWMVSLETDIVFGCELDAKQSHTSGGSTVRFLAGARYRR